MENITGFIVSVKPMGNLPIEYLYDGEKAILKPEEEFVGYFWQETEPLVNGKWRYAHVHKTSLIDEHKLLFRYEGKATFDSSMVKITIKAKRGPESNNRFLPKDFDIYETWNQINTR